MVISDHDGHCIEIMNSLVSYVLTLFYLSTKYMLHLGVKKEARPDAVQQRPEAEKFGLSVKHNPQKIPAAHGSAADAPFDALLPVEVGFISERIKIPADPRHVIQRHIGAHIVLRGMNHLTAPRHEGRQPASYGDPPGELDVIAPDEKFFYGKPEAAYGLRAQEQRHKGGLLCPHTLPQQLQPVIGHHHCRRLVLFFHMHHPQLRVESACAYSTFGWNLRPRKKPFQITPMRCHFLSVGLSRTRRE